MKHDAKITKSETLNLVERVSEKLVENLISYKLQPQRKSELTKKML